MGFRNGAYAKVWETKEGKGNWTDGKISISRRDRETGEYHTEFNSWVRFIGDANVGPDNLSQIGRIKIGECDVTNHYDKEKNVTYTNYAIFSFEDANGNSSSPASNESSYGFMNVPDYMDDQLPFN